jgi:type I restriction enzyme, S subunit
MSVLTLASEKTPRLRFSEFVGGWQRTSAKDVFSIFNGYAFSSNDAQQTGCRWIKIADVGILRMKSDTPSFLPSHFLTKHRKFVLDEGDYVIALTRPILNGELKIAQIDETHANSLLNQRVGKLVTHNIDGFVYFTLQRRGLVFQIDARISGTDPPNLAPSEIATLSIFVPTLPEQQKIAEFLTAVDARIQQLSQKKALLQDYKKSVMQQLFTQALRFKDDHGNDFPDWSDAELGDVLDYEQPTKYIVSSTEYKDEHSTPVLTAGKTFILGYTDETSGLCDKGLPLIIFDDFTTAYKFVDFPFKVKSSAMKILRVKDGTWDIRFVHEALSTIQFPIGEHKRYWISEYQFMTIPAPSLAEQTKIANFLTALDRKIESVAHQINHTRTFKRGLLQQMFV